MHHKHMTDNRGVSPSVGPLPRTKRRNAVLALYDSPVHRDWAFWMTAGWGTITALAIGTGEPSSSMPVWLDTVLAVLTFVILFGVFPSWLRLLVRRWLWRRHGTSPQPFPSGRLETERGLAVTPTIPPFTTSAHYPPPPSQPPAGTRGVQGRHVPEAVDLDLGETRGLSSNVMADARSGMPYPVARALRTLQQANTGKERYEAILDAAETLAISASVTAAAFLLARSESDAHQGDDQTRSSLSALRSALLSKGATFGTWTHWLEAVRPMTASAPEAVPGLRAALERDPDTPGLLERLDDLRKERNRAAHGDKPQSEGEATSRVKEIHPHLEGALKSAAPLLRAPWLLTVSAAYQPRKRSFDVIAKHAMGDHPDFERRRFNWRNPVATDVFYVLTDNGPITLSPFIASLFCPHCQQMEVCYAARAGKNTGPGQFKSFTRGHILQSEALGNDLRALPDSRRPR